MQMIEVDDSELTQEYQAFIKEWASAFGCTCAGALGPDRSRHNRRPALRREDPGLLPLIQRWVRKTERSGSPDPGLFGCFDEAAAS